MGARVWDGDFGFEYEGNQIVHRNWEGEVVGMMHTTSEETNTLLPPLDVQVDRKRKVRLTNKQTRIVS